MDFAEQSSATSYALLGAEARAIVLLALLQRGPARASLLGRAHRISVAGGAGRAALHDCAALAIRGRGRRRRARRHTLHDAVIGRGRRRAAVELALAVDRRRAVDARSPATGTDVVAHGTEVGEVRAGAPRVFAGCIAA